MKMTRWGKANPGKAQVLITILQIALMMLGMIAGYNFYKLGYEFSNTTAFVFGTIMIACFLSVHFLPKRGTIAIPAEVNKHRIIFMGIALSSFVLMVITGNRVEDKYPNSFVAHSLKAIDQAIFHDNNVQYADLNVTSGQVNSEGHNQVLAVNSSTIVIAPNEIIEPNSFSGKENHEKLKAEKKVKKLEKKKARMMKRLEKLRVAFAGGTTVGAVLLMILLICTLCAGVCLIIAGFSGSAGLIPLGAVIAGGSIWGIIKISKGNRKVP